MTLRCLLTTVSLLLLAVLARAGEPTIAEMLEDATAMVQKPSEKPKETDPAKAVADSDYVKLMKKRLEMELGKRERNFRQRREYRRIGNIFFDIQQYEKATQYLHQGTKNQRDWHTQQGMTHLALARAYTMLGHKKLAEKAVADADSRAGRPWSVARVQRHKDWAKRLPKHKEQVEKLRPKAAANPKDAKSRWRLLDLYRRDYPSRLDEFVGLMQFRELYPKHRQVTVGECDWRLMAILWHFGIRDEAFKMAKEFREKYPKHGCTTGGEAVWRQGNYHEALGERAKARECYLEVRSKFPKHWTNRDRPGQPKYIDERIARLSGG